MNSFLGVSWLQWGAGGLVLLIVVMILMGKLATPRAIREVHRERDESVARADANAQAWRDAYMTLLRSQDVSIHYMGQLTEVGTTMNKLLGAVSPSNPSGGDDHDAPSRT
jgi:Na+-transporting methylmalonyl-CoA/oxaloacetate decarboxylase gamma subunit